MTDPIPDPVELTNQQQIDLDMFANRLGRSWHYLYAEECAAAHTAIDGNLAKRTRDSLRELLHLGIRKHLEQAGHTESQIIRFFQRSRSRNTPANDALQVVGLVEHTHRSVTQLTALRHIKQTKELEKKRTQRRETRERYCFMDPVRVIVAALREAGVCLPGGDPADRETVCRKDLYKLQLVPPNTARYQVMVAKNTNLIINVVPNKPPSVRDAVVQDTPWIYSVAVICNTASHNIEKILNTVEEVGAWLTMQLAKYEVSPPNVLGNRPEEDDDPEETERVRIIDLNERIQDVST